MLLVKYPRMIFAWLQYIIEHGLILYQLTKVVSTNISWLGTFFAQILKKEIHIFSTI